MANETNNNGYMVLLHEKSLDMEVLAFKQGIKILHELIECGTIDHATGIDELEHRSIDMWVDDEGLLNERMPTIIFVDENQHPTGQLVGNILFQKTDLITGESVGMTPEETTWLQAWIMSHQVAQYQSEMVYHGIPSGDTCHGIVIYPEESVEHRKRISDMMQYAKDNGWNVMGF